MSKLIFGCGYLGSRVARSWLETDRQVFVVTRSTARAEQLAAEGYSPIVADVTRPETLADLPAAETVLVAVGYDRSSGRSIGEVYAGGMRSVLAALPPETGRVIYISSTGVYTQSGGIWVDESSPCEPRREGGRAALAAEQELASHRLGPGSVVLRLAGIYGPDRIPHVELVQSGRPIPVPPDGFLNLIHVDDAARAVVAAAEDEAPSGIYCVSDGNPTSRRDFYGHLARLLKAPEPTFTEPAADAPVRDRASTDKRVRNNRLLTELGVQLRYPTFREGLAAVVGSAAEP